MVVGWATSNVQVNDFEPYQKEVGMQLKGPKHGKKKKNPQNIIFVKAIIFSNMKNDNF